MAAPVGRGEVFGTEVMLAFLGAGGQVGSPGEPRLRSDKKEMETQQPRVGGKRAVLGVKRQNGKWRERAHCSHMLWGVDTVPWAWSSATSVFFSGMRSGGRGQQVAGE